MMVEVKYFTCTSPPSGLVVNIDKGIEKAVTYMKSEHSPTLCFGQHRVTGDNL